MTRSPRQPPAASREELAGGEAGKPAVRRGDLVVICLRYTSWASTRPARDDEVWAGEVTSVTLGGRVRLYRPAGRHRWEPDVSTAAARGEALPSSGLQRTWFLSAGKADVAGALATAACHTWPGHENQVRPYDSVGQGREALRPHLLNQPGWERLRDAARAWEEARRAACPLLSEAVAAMETPEFTGLSAAYHTAIAAANVGYRRQYAQATGQGSEDS